MREEKASDGRSSEGPAYAKTDVVDRSADFEAHVHAPEEPKRAEDRNLDFGNKSDAVPHEKLGTFLVMCAFAVGVAGGIGFVFAYWLGVNNLWLGGTLALALGGTGAALVLAARWLMPRKQAIEPREVLPSSTTERKAFVEDFCASAHEVKRRSMLKWMGAAVGGVFTAMVISLLRSFGMNPDNHLFTRVWNHGQRLMTAEGNPISISSLQPGSYVTVFPEDSIGDEKSQTVLIRVEENLLQLPSGRANWAPSGYVAYSRVCTHAGCPVGLYEPDTHLLLCPCHQSTFNVLQGASPTGGPAARPLPQLPLYADDDGNLRARGGFTAPPGPGFWGMS